MSDKLYFRIVFAVSIVVCLAVVLLNEQVIPKPDTIPAFVPFLPKLNALINATCSILLLISFNAIRNKKIGLHKRINIITFLLSAVFLVSYVTFHYLGHETRFPLENPIRPFYLTILISHIILAALVLPLVLLSFYHGLKMNIPMHRKLTRWTFPIWLYVTVTGVIVYLLISPYYSY